jgi:hypothetical protein
MAGSRTATATANEPRHLHFLDANRVEHMAGVEVCTEKNEKLGAIDGFLIERDTRRLCYFVVEPDASNERCLLPADTPAVLDVERHMLRVDADPGDLEHLTAPAGERPSDDDLIEAIYRHSAA